MSAATLGRLVVRDGPEPAPAQTLGLPARLLLLLLAVIAAVGLLWWRGYLWGSLGPRKVIVRGCELLPARGIIDRLAFSGSESVPQLWWRARGAAGKDERWLRAVNVGSDWGRVAVLNVHERRPLLQLKSGAAQYWLCDDSWLVERRPEDDAVLNVDRLAGLPRIVLADDPGPGPLAGAQDLIFVASACHQLLPGVMDKLERARDGNLTLYERGGFPILLGQDFLPEKLGALPKALRVCEGHKDQLRYLDARNHSLFYEKWKEAQQ